jgi:hypothetical protein
MADFTEHLSSLDLYSFNLTLQIGLVATLIGTLVSFRNCILSEASGFKVLLIKKALGSCTFIIKAQIKLGPKSNR